jgi:hypothetical protein
MFYVLVCESLLDLLWRKVTPAGCWAGGGQPDARAVLLLVRCGDHPAECLLHHGIQRPMLAGGQRLQFGKQLVVDADGRPV